MTGEETPRPHSDVRRYRRYVEQELDNVVLYRQLAEGADGEHRTVLLNLADAEERHARYWQQKLAELGVASGDVATHRPARPAGRPMVRSGLRQLLIGSLTASGTYLVGLGFGGVIA